ncbi:hypothetical protein ACR80R_18230, partial [Aquipuribacter sp. MA13-13]
RPPTRVVAEVEVWRAAMHVAPTDRRPTGATQLQKAARTWQRTLDQHVQGDRTPALAEWGPLLHHLSPTFRTDPFTPILADRLAALSRAGVDARTQVTRAASEGPLPDDHGAAALWWRISRHVSPAVATTLSGPSTRNDHGKPLTAGWAADLQQVLGDERAKTVMASPWWPALVTVIDHGLRRGWHPHALLSAAAPPPLRTQTASDTTAKASAGDLRADGGDGRDGDECLAMVWRASVLTDPTPADVDHDALEDPAPPDLWDGVEPDTTHLVIAAPAPTTPTMNTATHGATDDAAAEHPDPPGNLADNASDTVTADLAVQAQLRRVMGAPEPSAMNTERALHRAYDIETSP